MITRERKVIVFRVDGKRVKILPSDFSPKIWEFMKTLTGNDYGAFLIYQDGFLNPEVQKKLKEMQSL